MHREVSFYRFSASAPAVSAVHFRTTFIAFTAYTLNYALVGIAFKGNAEDEVTG